MPLLCSRRKMGISEQKTLTTQKALFRDMFTRYRYRAPLVLKLPRWSYFEWKKKRARMQAVI